MKHLKTQMSKDEILSTSDCIYWTQILNNERLVYVTVQKEINHFILLTCFKYKL